MPQGKRLLQSATFSSAGLASDGAVLAELLPRRGGLLRLYPST